jgi:Tol biopolymer transport system component
MRYFWFLLLLLLFIPLAQAQSTVREICPNTGIQPRPAEFTPSGIIITAFDGSSLWVYDIQRATRYPLPESAPCTSSCNLSPDARWLTYLNPQTFSFNKMRLDGTERTPLASNASEVTWWSADTLLIWTPDHRAYLRPEADALAVAEMFDVRGVRSIQPNGHWALTVEQGSDGFNRYMVNLENRGMVDEQRIFLAPDRPYFNAARWSPDGRYLAYVGNSGFDDSVGIAGGELYLAQPGSAIPQQMTYFFDEYGAVRINGYMPGDLSWSLQGRHIAFWVIELLGSNPEANTGNAVLHVLDVHTGELLRYCGFATTEHTPNTSRLIWSPDGTHIAFSGNVVGDNKGSLLLTLNIETGIFTELSDGIFPAMGQADVYAWGIAP